MKNLDFPSTAGAIGQLFGAKIIGDDSVEVRQLSPLGTAGPGCLSFLASRKHRNDLSKAAGAVVLTTEEFERTDLPITLLIVPDPQRVFAQIAGSFGERRFAWQGVSSLAVIDPTAVLARGVVVGPFCTIEAGARIGAHTRVHPYCYVGTNVEIGENCELFPRVTLLEGVRIGNRVRIFPHSVLGADGFGFIETDKGREAMPQVGSVVIEDDVRIGAGCTIDRGTIGDTRIRRKTLLDDQVHVGHNVQVGECGVLCAQVGIGGSAVLEEDVILGGQAGIGHGVRVGKSARVGGQSGSSSNIAGGRTYFLTPCTPIEDTVKILRYFRRLPEIWERLKRLETRLGDDRNG